MVLYDQLVSPDVLNLIRRDAERISVGKKAGAHSVPQNEINALLLEHARAGKRVVRLKGGDPFMFGRGAEELEAAKAADPLLRGAGHHSGRRSNRLCRYSADSRGPRPERGLYYRPLPEGWPGGGLARAGGEQPDPGDLHGAHFVTGYSGKIAGSWPQSQNTHCAHRARYHSRPESDPWRAGEFGPVGPRAPKALP